MDIDNFIIVLDSESRQVCGLKANNKLMLSWRKISISLEAETKTECSRTRLYGVGKDVQGV